MWETLWEVELAGYYNCLYLGVRRESFSFHCLEYSDVTDLRSTAARTWEEDCVLGQKHVEFEGLCNIQVEMSSGNLENLCLGQGKKIWQTQHRGKN